MVAIVRVAIIGAGIAGTAAAIALRSLGLDVHVYERRPHDADSTLGAGVVCWPNAAFVLDELGLLDRALARGHRIRAMRRVASTGAPLGSLPTTVIDEALGYPSFAILRASLHELLLERAVSAGAVVHFERGAAAILEGDPRTRLRLADGAIVDADLILGTDGRMRSVARRYVTGDAAPQDRGFVNWIGTVTRPTPTFDPGVVLDVWGVGARFGIVPLSPTRAYWAAGVARTSGGPADPSWPRRFSAWPSPIPELLRARDPAQTREIQIFDHDPIPQWHRHNVLLLGDAAHAAAPTSGQGVAQALEDVWHLHALLRAGADPTTVGPRLYALRSSKAAAIVQVGRTMAASLFDTDESGCAQRNARSLATDFTAAARGIATLWGGGLPLTA